MSSGIRFNNKGIFVNKVQLVDAMSVHSGLTKADNLKALDAFMHVVETAVANKEVISLVGFMVISVKKRAARMGHNLQTKEVIQIPEAMIPVLKAGKRLKDAALGRVASEAETTEGALA